MLLYLGRFHPKKGVDNLIRAWCQREQKGEEVLVLAGPLEKGSDWINNLKDLAKEDSSIHWTGMLGGDLKWSALRLADSMILPSHQENYGMVVAEACSVGLPVYLTDKVNLWREIIDAGAGAVEVDTFEGIQKMVNKWTVCDHTKLSLAAKNCFTERLHISRTTERLIEVMKRSPI
jgi:glycosyltransferase involved in cell wall biosynthesis